MKAEYDELERLRAFVQDVTTIDCNSFRVFFGRDVAISAEEVIEGYRQEADRIRRDRSAAVSAGFSMPARPALQVYDMLREIKCNVCVDCAQWVYPLINGDLDAATCQSCEDVGPCAVCHNGMA